MFDIFWEYLPETIRKYINLQKALNLQKRGIYLHTNPELIASDLEYEPPIFLGAEVNSGVKIGKHTLIQSGHVFPDTFIGRYCSIGDYALIGAPYHFTHYLSNRLDVANAKVRKHASDEVRKRALKTSIGNDVWIGSHVLIRCGVTVQDGAVIGAGAIVVKDVPAYAIVVGVPAKVIKYRFSQDLIDSLIKLKWWELDEEILKKIPFDDVAESIKILEQIRRNES